MISAAKQRLDPSYLRLARGPGSGWGVQNRSQTVLSSSWMPISSSFAKARLISKSRSAEPSSGLGPESDPGLFLLDTRGTSAQLHHPLGRAGGPPAELTASGARWSRMMNRPEPWGRAYLRGPGLQEGGPVGNRFKASEHSPDTEQSLASRVPRLIPGPGDTELKGTGQPPMFHRHRLKAASCLWGPQSCFQDVGGRTSTQVCRDPTMEAGGMAQTPRLSHKDPLCS